MGCARLGWPIARRQRLRAQRRSSTAVFLFTKSFVAHSKLVYLVRLIPSIISYIVALIRRSTMLTLFSPPAGWTGDPIFQRGSNMSEIFDSPGPDFTGDGVVDLGVKPHHY